MSKTAGSKVGVAYCYTQLLFAINQFVALQTISIMWDCIITIKGLYLDYKFQLTYLIPRLRASEVPIIDIPSIILLQILVA